MTQIQVKFKKFNKGARIPEYAHMTDAGADVYATSKFVDNEGNVVYGLGFGVELPAGYYMRLVNRSSLRKTQMVMYPGTIDNGYRGEIFATFKRVQNYYGDHKSNECAEYEVGDKIAQLIIERYEQVEFVEVDELAPSDRGTNGHGSTGR